MIIIYRLVKLFANRNVLQQFPEFRFCASDEQVNNTNTYPGKADYSGHRDHADKDNTLADDDTDNREQKMLDEVAGFLLEEPIDYNR